MMIIIKTTYYLTANSVIYTEYIHLIFDEATNGWASFLIINLRLGLVLKVSFFYNITSREDYVYNNYTPELRKSFLWTSLPFIIKFVFNPDPTRVKTFKL